MPTGRRRIFHGLHHFVGHIIRCFGPNIDHFIIFFTLGNQPFGVLTPDFGDLIFRLL
jgi:hypothetical protein